MAEILEPGLRVQARFAQPSFVDAKHDLSAWRQFARPLAFKVISKANFYSAS
jgi:hypothetical protein